MYSLFFICGLAESCWLKQQARHVLWECEDHRIEPRFFLHDRDTCYSEGFDELLKNVNIEPVKTPYQAPNANACAERWVHSLRQECLNHLIIFGLSRLQYVLDEYKRFFNYHRPHRSIGNCIPGQLEQRTNVELSDSNKERSKPTDIQCQQFLGGLLKSYYRRAA